MAITPDLPIDAAAASSAPWFRALTAGQRRALIAAMLGWMFDAMDFLIYVLAVAGMGGEWASGAVLVSESLPPKLPNLLATPIDKGGAGMTVVKSTGWLIPMQVGAFIGYLSFGPLADRFGRRRIFAAFLVAAALLVPVYGRMVHSPIALLVLSPLLGCVGHAYWSMFAPFLAELFPTAARATGQGLGYSSGRLLGALAPYVIGVLATIPRVGIASALVVTSAFYVAAAGLVFAFPDRSRMALE